MHVGLKCFLIADDSQTSTWQVAHDYCQSLDAVTMGNGDAIGPSLLYAESVDEYDSLLSHTNSQLIWLNCNRLNSDMTWQCVRDRDGTESSYRSELRFRGV